jgi:hypothetical protein
VAWFVPSKSLLPAALLLASTAAFAARAEEPPNASPPGFLAETVAEWKLVGTVVEKIDAGRYTYVQVDTRDGLAWAAAPHFEVAVGDTVLVPGGQQMTDFYSSSMDRRFERIYLVGSIRVLPQSSSATAAQQSLPAPKSEPAAAAPGIERAKGGKTLAEIFEEKAELAGQTVVLRARVVKSLKGILGKNWIHVQDGTRGPDGVHDLVVTTQDVAEVGDLVLVTGTVAVDTDLGYGYQYAVMVESARVEVE